MVFVDFPGEIVIHCTDQSKRLSFCRNFIVLLLTPVSLYINFFIYIFETIIKHFVDKKASTFFGGLAHIFNAGLASIQRI